MLTPQTEKRLLQGAIMLACLVPLSAGLAGMLRGAAWLGGGGADLDSHLRYLSGLLLGIGVVFAAAIPSIERRGGRVRLLTFLVMVGGIGRLAGFVLGDAPGVSMQLALGMELVVTPLLCLWQGRVARRMASEGQSCAAIAA